jgi:hypothetical protein
MAPAPPIELFMELKPLKNSFTDEVEPYQTGPKSLFGVAPEPNFTPELAGASQTPQLQTILEQPNSMEFVEL